MSTEILYVPIYSVCYNTNDMPELECGTIGVYSTKDDAIRETIKFLYKEGYIHYDRKVYYGELEYNKDEVIGEYNGTKYTPSTFVDVLIANTHSYLDLETLTNIYLTFGWPSIFRCFIDRKQI